MSVDLCVHGMDLALRCEQCDASSDREGHFDLGWDDALRVARTLVYAAVDSGRMTAGQACVLTEQLTALRRRKENE